MQTKYRQFESADAEVVAGLIQALYREDPEGKPMQSRNIQKTFESLRRHPDRGTIMVLEHEDEIVGYALLINYWSNEFGGNILHIDELYIKKAYRSRGTGTNFIKYLAKRKVGDAVALQLETTPQNQRARKLYARLGFKPRANTTFDLGL